jgi:RNA polymerase sigma-70 factor (ECF subfamily)
MSTIVMSEHKTPFDTIFKEYARLIYRTAYGVTGNRQDAEDVLQTIFLKLVGREFPPDLRKNPEAYLYRAAVNASLNVIRSRRREVLVGGNEYFEWSISSDSDESEAKIQRLYQAIAELDSASAEMLLLRYMHNKSDAEIARMLGKSRGTVALKLFRSRARLRKLLLAKTGDE